MYMGMHTLADIVGGLLAASGLLFFLIPLGIQHQHQGNWQKLSFKTNSQIHWNIFSWLSRWVPLVLAPCSLGHSPSLCSGEPVQIGHWWPLSQISMTINIFDTFLDVLIFPPKIQRQSSSILVQTDGPQLEETRQVGDNSCWPSF